MADLPLPCALCGARDTTRLYTKSGFGIARCRACGLVYATPRAPEEAILGRYTSAYFWNEYLPAVGAPGGTVDPDFFDERHAPMLALLRRHAPGARRLLEVGTGAGLFLKSAERAGWEVCGLELSAEGARFARDRLGLDVRPERAEQMSFPERSFDVAVMFDVIEHLFDPRAVLEATRRALKPGGLLAVSTPNFDALSRFALGEDWAVLSPLEHLYYFTESTLTRFMESAGFVDAKVIRRYPSWGPTETMNYHYSHAPHSLRNRIYGGLVQSLGRLAYRGIQKMGRGDGLIAMAWTKN